MKCHACDVRTSAQPPQEPAVHVLGVRRDNQRLLLRAVGVVGAAVFHCLLHPWSIFLPNKATKRCPWPQDSPSVAQALLSCTALRRPRHSQEINVLRPSLWANTRFVSSNLLFYWLLGTFVYSWQNVALVNANGAITRSADPGVGPGSAEQATSSALCKVTTYQELHMNVSVATFAFAWFGPHTTLSFVRVLPGG